MSAVRIFRDEACGRSDEFVRLRRGVYVRAGEWAEASVDERQRARIDAVAATWTAPFFLRESAAAVWGLPLVEPLAETVHVEGATDVGSRTRNGVAEHRGARLPSLALIDGLAVSDLAQTVFDLARFSSFRRAVVAADHALRLVDEGGSPLLTREELLRRHAELPPGSRGRTTSAAVIAFADPASETPLESISRVAVHVGGLPAPVLQHPVRDQDGLAGIVDFFFEEAGVIGEADGDHKYTDPAFLRGRSPEQMLLAEKRREDRLRARVRSVVRWGWREAYEVRPLLVRLARAGVRRVEGTPNRRGSRLFTAASTVRGSLGR
ncbi:hypothetical protein C5D34_15795 [Rathayibacter sp. AY1B1]|uniref:hypothetical protein n=1 Tax=unclassified Rathayibacter TaxID=2609250 RepID=UPI000CE828BF|nr:MULTISPECIES: hypothetical protein [unclassified Rathayibacter]PPI20766.1 hypothetical protein C5D08_09995 [Rathayibacter sp. AY1B6]PPI28084.1 hypothetical protein C5D34_15795 [Rathayibacter sp. AY1B1]